MLKVIIKEPNKTAVITTIAKTLKEYQKLVNGYIECIPYPNINNVSIIVNEEGKLKGLQPNFNLPEYGEAVVGTAIIVGVRGVDFTNIPNNKIQPILEYLKENDIWVF